MKIKAVEAVPFALPIRRRFRWNGLDQELGEFVLVRVVSDTGIVGYGEATPLASWGGEHGRHGGETLFTVRHMVETVIGPHLIGRDPTAIGALIPLMDELAIGHTYAKCAIEMALHDLWGKAAGLPVHRLLGGIVRPGVVVAHMVGLMDVGEAIAEAEAASADGIKALQIKGGQDAERDIELLHELRRRLPDMRLRLDANQGYKPLKVAFDVSRRLDGAGIDYIEQPVAGLSDIARVTAESHVKIIADESCWSPRDALDLVAARGADAISIYLAKAGGMRRAGDVAAIAEAAGLPCDVNGSIESAIGNAANLAFALSTRAVCLPAVIPISAPAGTHPCKIGGHYFEDDVISTPFPFADGMLLPLEAPGLGIEVDEAKVRKYAL
ncbi:mandelate racemase/muconate lactonizing enzyme family protein [Ancylobacter pratisalsi]|uniref:Muconate cycloisomerase n=1 Tax=Ancylobacter pratisalsi TaxID=1745854 RepID=A0A6P1YIV4_9HYPH|nr:enolase C-terminal domain-like protein [Ancylobacter pratisalsi]QIB33072.1 muconate cycloisomerase [Ancylobacter pratisalsi]